MTAWEVKENLSHLTEWESSQQDEILSLCKASLKEIESMLKADADRSDARITCAAAANAYYKLTLKRSFSFSSEDIMSFKAGDVSITQGTRNSAAQLENAEKLYLNSLRALTPLCNDDGFAFENIRIKVTP